jgi:hypothetical protein
MYNYTQVETGGYQDDFNAEKARFGLFQRSVYIHIFVCMHIYMCVYVYDYICIYIYIHK